MTQVNSAPFLVITVIEGAVLGGGFGLTCVSDVALAKADAQFGMPETRFRHYSCPNCTVYCSTFGLTWARRLALLGMRINGQQAQAMGLHEVHMPIMTA